MTITQSDLQPEFRREVAAMPGGELAGRCFDCGTCAGVCPVSEAEPGFDPRKILHMLKLGLKEKLLKSEMLWYCSHCDTCTFACPQNIRFNNVVDVLREMALKQGYVDEGAFEKWGTGPCKAACPAHISIQGFVGAIARGAYAEGLRLIKEEMPFPSACGRVCHHPCEAACNRGQVDEPVSIMRLKRFLADVDLAKEAAMYVPVKKAKKDKKVAVVGSGPAGLTAAYFLAVEGYSVTVFEKDSVPGGMMAVGIPEYRLPAAVLQAEIKAVESLGVTIKLNSPVGEDLTFEDLRKQYDAVFLGVGLPKSFKLNVPGEDVGNVVSALDYLKASKLKRDIPAGRNVVVVGGGNVAIDSARTALRQGAAKVVMIMLESSEEQPASPWEIAEAKEEGVEFLHRQGVNEVRCEDGKVSGLVLKQCTQVFDGQGGFCPQYDECVTCSLKADLVITSIGQCTDLSFLGGDTGLKVSPRGIIEADPLTGTTSVAGVFAGGDVISGPRTVVEAVAAGKKAAISIDRYLQGKDIARGREKEWKGIAYTGSEKVELEKRESMPCLSPSESKTTFREIELGFEEGQARREAGRCLRICGMQKKL